METIVKIRRRHKVKGESISSIALDLKLSRNTVKKYLNAEADPAYRRSQQPAPKLGALQSMLETWLEQDSQRLKRERRTARPCLKTCNEKVMWAPTTACSAS